MVFERTGDHKIPAKKLGFQIGVSAWDSTEEVLGHCFLGTVLDQCSLGTVLGQCSLGTVQSWDILGPEQSWYGLGTIQSWDTGLGTVVLGQ